MALVPIFHSYSLSVVTLHKLSVGMKVVTPQFQPQTTVDVQARHKFDFLFLGSSPQITLKHLERLRRDLSAAAPLPETDIQKFVTKVGHAGELLIKGPNIMKGYKNNSVANEQVFVDGDWFRTGDLASIDENGAVYILDKLKELIKVSGFQVPPAELQAVVKEHPAVFDAAVIGVKDPRKGERPKTFIQLNEGFKLDSEDIIKFVNERVAPYL